MAHESFEDAATAAEMNELFVNIKVDREERPDIDAIYMRALHSLGEQGGWPLTMFLDSEARPFWGGTYFPPTPRFGRPSFPARAGARWRASIARSPTRSPTTPACWLTALKERQPGGGAAPDLSDAGIAALDRPDGPRGRSAPRRPRRRAQVPAVELLLAAVAPAPSATAIRRRCRPWTPRSPISARAASTTTWAAASRATRWTSAGWRRTSRRCSTTTRCSST